MNNKIFAIGDIHGCYAELLFLMNKLRREAGLNHKKDTVVFLGDYIDHGPDSKKVIERLMFWQKKYPHWKFLYGNHEDLMLDALVYNGRIYHSYDLWWMQGGKETAQSYIPSDRTEYEKAISSVKDNIPFEHLEWLRNLPIYYETDKYFFVHGGVKPDLSLKEQKKALKGRFGEELKQEMLWIRDEFIESDFDWGKKIVFGHSIASKAWWGKFGQPIIMKNKIGLDGAVCAKKLGSNLIAVELPAEKFYFQESII